MSVRWPCCTWGLPHLTCDTFPLTVQLWPWTPGHPEVPGCSPVEYCFSCRHAQLTRQKDHAAAPKHPTIGCLFCMQGKKKVLNPFLGTGVMWVCGWIFFWVLQYGIFLFIEWKWALLEMTGNSCTILFWNPQIYKMLVKCFATFVLLLWGKRK